MSTARQRLSARDYKHGGRRSGTFGLAQYRQFGLGLGIGLAVALFVWLQGQRAQPAPPAPQAAEPAPEIAAADEIDPAGQLDFYDMLPSFEVVVPAENRNAGRDQRPAPITKPGAYILQAGAYHNRAEAERQRDRLAKQGIDATIQHVIIDDSERHRVIIGPSRDLAHVNETIEALRAAQVTFWAYWIGE